MLFWEVEVGIFIHSYGIRLLTHESGWTLQKPEEFKGMIITVSWLLGGTLINLTINRCLFSTGIQQQDFRNDRTHWICSAPIIFQCQSEGNMTTLRQILIYITQMHQCLRKDLYIHLEASTNTDTHHLHYPSNGSKGRPYPARQKIPSLEQRLL